MAGSAGLRRLLGLILELDHGQRFDPNLAGARSILIHRTNRIPTKRTTVTRQFPSGLGFERADMSGCDTVARQRAPAGNSLNDEQWSDHLSDPSITLDDLSKDRDRGRIRT